MQRTLTAWPCQSRPDIGAGGLRDGSEMAYSVKADLTSVGDKSSPLNESGARRLPIRQGLKSSPMLPAKRSAEQVRSGVDTLRSDLRAHPEQLIERGCPLFPLS
jgi:hypothetical protein